MMILHCALLVRNVSLYCVPMKQTEEVDAGKKWSETITSTIGENVQSYRKLAGISAQKLSEETGELGYAVPRNTITNLENGRKATVTLQELLLISRALHVPMSALIANPLDGMKPIDVTPIGNTKSSWDAFEQLGSNTLEGPELYLDAVQHINEYTNGLKHALMMFLNYRHLKNQEEKAELGLDIYDKAGDKLDRDAFKTALRRAELFLEAALEQHILNVRAISEFSTQNQLAELKAWSPVECLGVEELEALDIPESLQNWRGNLPLPDTTPPLPHPDV